MNNAVILVIDDESQIRKLLEITLDSNGFKTTFAATAKEGLLLAASHPPDMILLDLGLLPLYHLNPLTPTIIGRIRTRMMRLKIWI